MQNILSILGLAVSIAALVPIFTKKNLRLKVFVMVLTVSLIALSVAVLYNTINEQRSVGKLKEEVMRQFANHRPMTFEQIHLSLNYPDFNLLSQAIDELLDEHLLDQATVTTKSDGGNKYEVRAYNYSAFPIE